MVGMLIVVMVMMVGMVIEVVVLRMMMIGPDAHFPHYQHLENWGKYAVLQFVQITCKHLTPKEGDPLLAITTYTPHHHHAIPFHPLC